MKKVLSNPSTRVDLPCCMQISIYMFSILSKQAVEAGKTLELKKNMNLLFQVDLTLSRRWVKDWKNN